MEKNSYVMKMKRVFFCAFNLDKYGIFLDVFQFDRVQSISVRVTR